MRGRTAGKPGKVREDDDNAGKEAPEAEVVEGGGRKTDPETVMEGTGCGVDKDWGDWLLEETVAKVGTLADKVVGLLGDTDIVVGCLGKALADGTKQSEDWIPGITADYGSS